jgi:hypothetical protein
MLVSQAISENSIPAIAKTVEIYIAGNKMGEVINNPNFEKAVNANYKIKSGKIIAREQGGPPGSEEGKGKKDSEELKKEVDKLKEELEKAQSELEELKKSKADERRIWRATQAVEKAKVILQKRRQDFEERKYAEQQREKEAEKAEEKKKEEEKKLARASAKVTVSDYKSISLEPTTLTVDYKRGDEEIRRHIGIKVLPLRVKSEARLSHLIMNDIKLTSIQAQLVGLGRTVMRYVWRFIDRWARILRIGGLAPSGDPRRDVIMARSGHSGQAFIVMSKNEDIDDFFVSDMRKIRKLSKLGWGNFIIADDINRQAYFCFQAFKGVCNVISYEMMYNNLGQLKVYETLEDAKKKSSSLFKIKRRFSRVVGESLAEKRLSDYLFLREDK